MRQKERKKVFIMEHITITTTISQISYFMPYILGIFIGLCAMAPIIYALATENKALKKRAESAPLVSSDIVVTLPDGRKLIAKDKRDNQYPGIIIELVNKNRRQECISWVEYNTVRDNYASEQRLRLLLWKKDGDEPAVNMAYDTGEFEKN